MGWVWTWTRRILSGLFALCVLVFTGFVMNGRMADDFEVASLNLDPETRVLVLLFHGSNGADLPVWSEIADRVSQLNASNPQSVVVKYNWSVGSDKRMRAGANAEVFARALGQEIARLEKLEYVQLIAHSAGSYILDPLCESYRERVAQTAHVEMTFLDPFGSRDLVDVNRGNRNYGSCADYASAYISTDDPVPSTNSPLRQAYNFDVTNSSARAGFTQMGHVWPLFYYLQVLDETLVRPGARNHNDLPRGQVSTVD